MQINFDPNDFKSLLHLNLAEQASQLDPQNWFIGLQTGNPELVDLIPYVRKSNLVTLNYLTGYGRLMHYYTLLSDFASPRQDFYKSTLTLLLERSRLPSEALAVWVSLNSSKKNKGSDLRKRLLTGNTAFLHYYDCADQLVKGIPSLEIKKLVLFASVHACFASAEVLESAIASMSSADSFSIPESEYPNGRFIYLLNQLPEDFLLESALKCCEELENNQLRTNLMNALTGDESQDNILDEDEPVRQMLLEHIFRSVNSYFLEFGSKSLNTEEQTKFVLTKSKEQYDNLAREISFVNLKREKKSLEANSLRNIVLRSEHEEQIFSESPISCALFEADGNDETLVKFLRPSVQDIGHIFIMFRTFSSLKGQYLFDVPEQYQLVNKLEGPFAAIRTISKYEENFSVVYWVFKKPYTLTKFLNQYYRDIPIHGCLTQSTRLYTDWVIEWRGFFLYRCNYQCVLLDVSPVQIIEEYCLNKKAVTYEPIVAKYGRIIQYGMVFKIEEYNDQTGVILFPCTENYSTHLCNYIESSFPILQKGVGLTDKEREAYLIVLANYTFGEHKFKFSNLY